MSPLHFLVVMTESCSSYHLLNPAGSYEVCFNPRTRMWYFSPYFAHLLLSSGNLQRRIVGISILLFDSNMVDDLAIRHWGQARGFFGDIKFQGGEGREGKWRNQIG